MFAAEKGQRLLFSLKVVAWLLVLVLHGRLTRPHVFARNERGVDASF